MTLKELVPWRFGSLRRWDEDERAFPSFRRDFDNLHREMDRMIEEFFRGSPLRGMQMTEGMSFGDVMPTIDVAEDEKVFRISVELPGMDEKDIDVTLTEGLLTIRGEKKQEHEDKGKEFYRKERSFGSFRRAIPLPVDVDESKIDASFKKGVLLINLPKTEEAKKKVRHIDVKAA
ncbi:MAG TPA: Hsp20/alpha crystallin family protein [Steroidobacteraceae bacterium]|nr:Hsp20/alpha crystallin family protein [Steroidobacteraceae bacterium]